MREVILPKVAIIPLYKPTPIPQNGKKVRIVSGKYINKGVLFTYNKIEDVFDLKKELKNTEDDYFLIDENRAINYNRSNLSFINGKTIKQSTKYNAENSKFYIYDYWYDTYWVLNNEN